MASAQYYAKLNRSLKVYGITLDEFKKNPASYFYASKSYRTWVMKNKKFSDDMTWYGKDTSWKTLLGQPPSAFKDDTFTEWTKGNLY